MEHRGATGAVPERVQLSALLKRRARQQLSDGTAIGPSLVVPVIFIAFGTFLVASINSGIPEEGPLAAGDDGGYPGIYFYLTADLDEDQTVWYPVIENDDAGFDSASLETFESLREVVFSKGGVTPGEKADYDDWQDVLDDIRLGEFGENEVTLGGYELNGPVNETGVTTDGASFSTGMDVTVGYDPERNGLLPTVHAVQFAMMWNLTGASNFTRDLMDLTIGLQTAYFPGIDLFVAIVPPFIVQALFNAVNVMAASLVKDRTDGTKFQLQVSGVPARVYWLSNFLIDFALYMLVVVIITVFFIVTQTATFIETHWLAWVLFFVLVAPVVVLCGYNFQYMFEDDETANKVLGPLISIVVFIPYFLVQFVFDNNLTFGVRMGASLFLPTYNCYNALTDLAANVGVGRPLDTVGKVLDFEFDFVWNVCILVLHIVLLATTLLLLDRKTRVGTGGSAKVAPDSLKRKDEETNEGRPPTPNPPLKGLAAAAAVLKGEMSDPGVEEEKKLCKDTGNEELLVRIDGVHKTFDGVKYPVRNVSLTIRKGECFGLLGRNGAGKTTLVSMLSGQIPLSYGDATIVGHSVTNEMDSIYPKLGVCPQFDRLWTDISVRQHLQVYAAVKGIPKEEADKEVDRVIGILGLEPHAEKKTKELSGGNKRKTSVAMAILGRPPIVYLDEPTTGMDPATRRALWDVIIDLAKESSIVLTTHSMEEADALCSRIGIMVNGELVTVGSTQALKSRYGGDYTVSTRSATPEKASAAAGMIAKLYGGSARLNQSLGGSNSYEVRPESVDLATTFQSFEAAKQDGIILDYSISQGSVESVFLAFAEQQESSQGGKGKF